MLWIDRRIAFLYIFKPQTLILKESSSKGPIPLLLGAGLRFLSSWSPAQPTSHILLMFLCIGPTHFLDSLPTCLLDFLKKCGGRRPPLRFHLQPFDPNSIPRQLADMPFSFLKRKWWPKATTSFLYINLLPSISNLHPITCGALCITAKRLAPPRLVSISQSKASEVRV